MSGASNNENSSPVEKAAQTASTINGAVKAGKAMAGIAKGAAAGPYGAAAMAVWENRKLVGKIIAGAALILFIPILFILMLPSLIFGDLNETPASPIMNDNVAIVENITKAETTVAEILTQSHDAIIKEINEKINKLSDEDESEIIDPFHDNISFNSVLLVSEYCASKDNFKDINVADLKSTINSIQSELYSYETSEVKIIKDDNQTVMKYTYTVSFVGESYFTNKVFKLTDQQKTLSLDYAQNLSVFLDGHDYDTAVNTKKNLSQYITDNPFSGTSETFLAPFTDQGWNSKVTSPFGSRRDPITGKPSTFHSGVDIGYPKGTDITAPLSGRVLFVIKSTTGYGYHLAINHGNGLVTLYAHCSQILVVPGQTITQKDTIAKVGSTGRSTGPHLHFEVILNDEFKNPLDYIQ